MHPLKQVEVCSQLVLLNLSSQKRPRKFKNDPLLHLKFLILLFARQGTSRSSKCLRQEYGRRVFSNTVAKDYIKRQRRKGSIFHYFPRHQGKRMQRKYLKATKLVDGEHTFDTLTKEIKACLVDGTWECDRIIGSDIGSCLVVEETVFATLCSKN